MSKPLTRQSMGNSTGYYTILLNIIIIILYNRTPLTFYDEDSKMLFVGIKVSQSILCC